MDGAGTKNNFKVRRQGAFADPPSHFVHNFLYQMGEDKFQNRIGACGFWNNFGKESCESCGCWFNDLQQWLKHKKFNWFKQISNVFQFCAAYLNWRQLNLDQEHRFEMGQSWWGCYLLDAYYRFHLNSYYFDMVVSFLIWLTYDLLQNGWVHGSKQ